jgi:ribosomal protein S27E
MQPERAGSAVPRNCPDCGRAVPASGAKLCPHCGYPLLFEGGGQAEEVQPEILRKPVGEERPDQEAGVHRIVQVQPVRQQEVLGPHCPACGHRNAARRVRCEICAAELWPGATSPARAAPMPPPQPVHPPRQRRGWVTPVALVTAVLGGMVLVYLLTYALA